MSIQEKRDGFFDRANGINANVGALQRAAVRMAECESRLLLQEAFPSNHFVTSDSCLSLPGGHRFRIATSFWSDNRGEVVVVLDRNEFETSINLSDLMRNLQAGQIAPVGAP